MKSLAAVWLCLFIHALSAPAGASLIGDQITCVGTNFTGWIDPGTNPSFNIFDPATATVGAEVECSATSGRFGNPSFFQTEVDVFDLGGSFFLEITTNHPVYFKFFDLDFGSNTFLTGLSLVNSDNADNFKGFQVLPGDIFAPGIYIGSNVLPAPLFCGLENIDGSLVEVCPPPPPSSTLTYELLTQTFGASEICIPGTACDPATWPNALSTIPTELLSNGNVPAPATLALFALGLVGLRLCRKS